MLSLFFQSFSEDTKDLESEVEETMQGLKEKLKKEEGPERCIDLTDDFPEDFLKQVERLTIGDVVWSKFDAHPEDGLFLAHCDMEQGTAIQEHSHPTFDQFIYPVTGKLINWSRGRYDGDILVPPEKVDREIDMIHKSNVEGWYLVSRGNRHWIQAVETTTFVTKYVYND